MRFLDFCKSVTSSEDTKVTESNIEIPVKYSKSIELVINQFECNKDTMYNMDFPYIEHAFKLKGISLSDKMVEICDREFHTLSIPDSIINKLSNGIFCNNYNKLNTNNKIIIKTLSMYILLSNK